MDILHFDQTPHLRGHSKKLDKERSAKLPRKHFLTNRIVYHWNALSEDTVSAATLNSFKNRVDGELQQLVAVDSHYGQ